MTASARSSRESSPTSCSCRGTRCSTSPRWPTPSSLCRAAGYTGQKGSAMSSQARTTIVDGLLFDGVSPLRAEATIVVEGENIMSITGPSAAEPGPADADSLATKTSDAVRLSSCVGNFLAGGWECGGFVVLGVCGQAVVQAA